MKWIEFTLAFFLIGFLSLFIMPVARKAINEPYTKQKKKTMTRLAQIIIFSTIFFFSPTAYSESPLPEFYGIFIQDRGRLTKLEPNMPEEERRNFSENATIIIHDKRMGSGFVDPDEMVRILNRNYVRYNVETVLEQKDAPTKEINITPADYFGAFGEPLKIFIGPIKNQHEMVKIKPKEPYSSGMYYVEFDGERYAFSIELGKIPEKSNPLNGSLDKWYSAIDKNGTYKVSNALDEEAGKWRKEALAAINENRIYKPEEGHLILEKLALSEKLILNSNCPGFKGKFKGGCRHGQGTYSFPDGAKFTGEWKQGKVLGYGTITWPDGKVKYTGEWKNGKMHGQGRLSMPNGVDLSGEFKNGKADGNGTVNFPDGAKYVGEFKNGKRHGHGSLIRPDGSVKYEGEFRDDRMYKTSR